MGSYRVYVRARCPRVHVIFSRCFQISARLILRAVEQQSAGEQLVIIRLGYLLQHTIVKYYHFVLVLAQLIQRAGLYQLWQVRLNGLVFRNESDF